MKRISRFDAKIARGEKISAIIYCRVSTDEQEEMGSSLLKQFEKCKEYCDEKGFIIVYTIQESHSGHQLEQRVKFMDVKKRCKNGEADCIVFFAYDRLSRNRSHSTIIFHEAELYGYELFCVNEQFNTESMAGKMLRDMFAWFSDIDRKNIIDKTTDGLKKRALSGKLINGKKPRYGYAYEDTVISPTKSIPHTHYRIVESEAAVIHKIDTLYLEGYGQQTIADMLTREGIPTPTGKNRIWSKNTIGDIIECEEYHGVGYAFKDEIIYNEHGIRQIHAKPIEDRIKLPEGVFPIVRTYETYLALQERLERAHSTAITSHVPKEILLYGGFIRCAYCGRAMRAGLQNNGKYRVYKCAYPQYNDELEKHFVQIDAIEVETKVIDYVKSLLKKEGIIEVALNEYINSHSSEESVQSYEHAIAQIQEKQREIVKDMKETRGYAKELLMTQLNQLEDETEKLQKYKSDVVGDKNRWEVAKKEMRDIIEVLRAGNVDIDNADIKQKKSILKALGIRVLVHKTPGKQTKNTCHIRVTLPTLDNTARDSGQLS